MEIKPLKIDNTSLITLKTILNNKINALEVKNAVLAEKIKALEEENKELKAKFL